MRGRRGRLGRSGRENIRSGFKGGVSVMVTRTADTEQDVSYGEDWHSVAELKAWAEAADRKWS